MTTPEIGSKIDTAIDYLTQHPDEATYTDSVAVATLEHGLRCRVTGPDGASISTDMPAGVGGRSEHPSPGWLWRAALASCTASLVGTRAAHQGMELASVAVTVDSRSDDRGILGIDDATPAGPLSVTVRVRLTASGVDPDQLLELAKWSAVHCPVYEGATRAIPVDFVVEPG